MFSRLKKQQSEKNIQKPKHTTNSIYSKNINLTSVESLMEANKAIFLRSGNNSLH